MSLRQAILSMLYSRFKRGDSLCGFPGGVPWDYGTFIRSCSSRLERGEPQGWDDFLGQFTTDGGFARVIRAVLEDEWPLLAVEEVTFVQSCVARLEHGDSGGWHDLVERSAGDGLFAHAFDPFLQAVGGSVDNIHSEELDDLLVLLRPPAPAGEEPPAPTGQAKSAIMYVERKAGKLTGPARIGRVTFSKTGRTIYYGGRQFRSLKGRAFKANYFDVKTGEEYWISGPRRDGRDRLYGERIPIEIDEDAREEYWTRIRRQPGNVHRVTV
jgi:hypothetical protein